MLTRLQVRRETEKEGRKEERKMKVAKKIE
jgi:hypothetical protein